MKSISYIAHAAAGVRPEGRPSLLPALAAFVGTCLWRATAFAAPGSPAGAPGGGEDSLQVALELDAQLSCALTPAARMETGL